MYISAFMRPLVILVFLIMTLPGMAVPPDGWGGIYEGKCTFVIYDGTTAKPVKYKSNLRVYVESDDALILEFIPESQDELIAQVVYAKFGAFGGCARIDSSGSAVSVGFVIKGKAPKLSMSLEGSATYDTRFDNPTMMHLSAKKLKKMTPTGPGT